MDNLTTCGSWSLAWPANSLFTWTMPYWWDVTSAPEQDVVEHLRATLGRRTPALGRSPQRRVVTYGGLWARTGQLVRRQQGSLEEYA
ncbi:MAG TPA: hypothetical protein VLJ59_12955 [Mycobacteriales bacterium]|nr:hypothetical protein [Mycobacteriales bacterium]